MIPVVEHGPVVTVREDSALVYIEIGVAGAHPPDWAERAADATTVPHGSSAEFGCARSCWVHVVAMPDQAVPVIDAVALGLRVPGGRVCTAAMVGPIKPKMVGRLRRALRQCREGEGTLEVDEIRVPTEPLTGALLAAAPGGLLRDRLRAEGLVYTVDRDADSVAFVVPPEDRDRALAVLADVLTLLPTVSRDRWVEAGRVLDLDLLHARSSPAALAVYLERSLVVGRGVPDLGE